MTVSTGAVLAFIGVILFIYALYAAKESAKSAMITLGVSLLLIGLGLFLGITITITIETNFRVALVTAVIGIVLLALALHEKRVFIVITYG